MRGPRSPRPAARTNGGRPVRPACACSRKPGWCDAREPFCEPVVNLSPHLSRHHRFERRGRQLQCQIAAARVAAVDDGASQIAGNFPQRPHRPPQRRPCRRRVPRRRVPRRRVPRRRVPGVGARRGIARTAADQESRHLLDGLLRRRQPNSDQRTSRERIQSFQRQRQVAAALVPAMAWTSSTMTVRQVLSMSRPDCEPSKIYSDSGVVTTMCGGLAAHAGAFGLGRIARAHHRTNFHVGKLQRGEFLAYARERRLQIALNVVRQGP